MTMIKVVGLDSSLTGFGLAASSGDGVTVHRITPRLRGHERLELLLHQVGGWCEGAGLAVLEGLSFGARGNSLLDLAGLHCLVRHRLWQMNIPYAVIAPAQLKKFATGDAQADKIAMAVAASRRFTVEIRDSDTADAAWACAAGCQYAGQPIAKLPLAQVEVLTSVHTEKGRKGKPKIIWPMLLAA